MSTQLRLEKTILRNSSLRLVRVEKSSAEVY